MGHAGRKGRISESDVSFVLREVDRAKSKKVGDWDSGYTCPALSYFLLREIHDMLEHYRWLLEHGSDK